ncbi:MAG: DegV family protein [Clostridia bacterium]|nr:DegV family protein [Clostridia bacterium]NLS85979.1 DegV family protein [Oscillospiraceae bacterium]
MIRILTDSTCDISPEEAKQLGVSVVPLCVNFADKHYLDGVDITPEQFYEMLAEADKLPTTSQPSPEIFMSHFEAAKAAGDEVVCVLLSSALSGTYQSAEIAKDEVGYDKIHLIDSRAVTIALGLLVRRAVKDLNEGATAQEIVADIEHACEHVHAYAVVDTLKYLHKGGRLSTTAAIAGGLLGIKPVVGLVDGKVAMVGKARGVPGAYLKIFKLIDEVGGVDKKYPVITGYTGDAHGIEPFTRFIMQNLHMPKPHTDSIGAVIATHLGHGAKGIAFFDAQ